MCFSPLFLISVVVKSLINNVDRRREGYIEAGRIQLVARLLPSIMLLSRGRCCSSRVDRERRGGTIDCCCPAESAPYSLLHTYHERRSCLVNKSLHVVAAAATAIDVREFLICMLFGAESIRED